MDDSDLDLAVCTGTEYDENGFLGVQVDAFASSGRGISKIHCLSGGGVDHRPVDPDRDVGELAVRWFEGDEGFAFFAGDVRTEQALPNLPKGATRLFDTGVFRGDAFKFTVTLDPQEHALTVQAHRAGGVIELRNAEGLSLKLDGTIVEISGATSVKLGGQLEFAMHAQALTALNALSAAVTSVAGTVAALGNPAAPAAATAAQAAVQAFGSGGKSAIVKGG